VGGARVKQRLTTEFSGTVFHLPLAAQPERSVVALSQQEQLLAASFACP
jgi:hypothetical protein